MKAKTIETFEEGYNAAIKRLSFKDFSKCEMISYLKKRGLSDDIAQAVLNKLLELNYVNDERLCNNICNYMKNEGIYSKRALKFKLLKKGFAKNLVSEQLSAIEIDEYQNAGKIFYAYIKKQRCIDEKTKMKIIRHMASKGFSYNIIEQLLKENKDMLI